MKLSKLNIARWILAFFSPLPFFFFMYLADTGGEENMNAIIISCFLWFFSTIAIFILFIIKRSTISRGLKRSLLALIPISCLIYMSFKYIIKFQDATVTDLISGISGYTLIYAFVLCYICYLEKIEIQLLVYVFAIVAGFIANRLGVDDGEAVILFGFLLSSAGFIYLIFKSITLYKSNKTTGRLFIFFYTVFSVLNTLFLLKFTGSRPALNNFYDTTGVVIFLIACLTLFIILPFSNYVDWPRAQKLTFKRLIIVPLIFFLLIFAFKFLLPANTYRSIFFKEYSQKERVHFGMEDYKIDFSAK